MLTLRSRNWSFRKKMFVTINIMLLTFAIYAGSSIYTPSIPGLMEEYNSSLVVATLGLSLFVAFYGLGPALLVPMQELPSTGRTPVYIGSLFLFGLFTLTSAVARNMATVLVSRALAGFFGSPALSTGGATLADMWPKRNLAYVVGAWSMGAVLGPILAPTIGGYSAMYLGWRWPLWLLFFVTCGTWIALFFFLPETLHSNILYKRAARLRALTGRQDIKSHGQREQESVSFGQLMKNSLVRPLQLMTDPAPLFLSIYLGLCYGCKSLGKTMCAKLIARPTQCSTSSLNHSLSSLATSTTLTSVNKVSPSWATLSRAVPRTPGTVPIRNTSSTRSTTAIKNPRRKYDLTWRSTSRSLSPSRPFSLVGRVDQKFTGSCRSLPHRCTCLGELPAVLPPLPR